VAYLLYTGVSRNDLYMSTLDQWDPARARRESVKVVGFVAEDSVREDGERLVTEFVLRNEAGTRTVPVRYAGVTPDLFRSGAQVVASGQLQADGTFHANDLMTKCPSKYEGVDHPPVAPPAPAKGDQPRTLTTASDASTGRP
jgi:cytochrome c-type biogenesis protein CcmE